MCRAGTGSRWLKARQLRRSRLAQGSLWRDERGGAGLLPPPSLELVRGDLIDRLSELGKALLVALQIDELLAGLLVAALPRDERHSPVDGIRGCP